MLLCGNFFFFFFFLFLNFLYPSQARITSDGCCQDEQALEYWQLKTALSPRRRHDRGRGMVSVTILPMIYLILSYTNRKMNDQCIEFIVCYLR